MSRELSDEAARKQAEAFRAYADRCGVPLATAFRRWAASKDLGPADRRAVLRALRGEADRE